VNGSLSQYYYGGKTQVNTTFLNTPTTANQQSLTSTSQSSLVSTLDLSGRYRDENNDARLILRDTSDKSFIGGATPGTNRLDSAYIDYRNTSYGFSAKVGRQSGVTGGLIGRFDGAILGYDLSPKWRVNVTGGIPTDTLVNSRQNFEGVNVEAQNLWDHWSGDAFFMNQMADGVTDRRAIGGDLRYFDSVRTVYAMMDYDVIFRTLNAATLQGTWQLPDQTSLSVLVDVRKAPELLTDERFSSAKARVKHRDVLNEEIDKRLGGATSAEWVEKLNKAGVPAGPIYKMNEMFDDPQVKHLKMAHPVEHPKLGTIELIGQAINMSRTQFEMKTATPEQGEHTDAVLKEAGYDDKAIASFRQLGVI